MRNDMTVLGLILASNQLLIDNFVGIRMLFERAYGQNPLPMTHPWHRHPPGLSPGSVALALQRPAPDPEPLPLSPAKFGLVAGSASSRLDSRLLLIVSRFS